jgi:Ca-activated chloride channel family protein
MFLRDSEFKGTTNLNSVLELASSAKGKDDEGYRSEFIRLVKTSGALK